ncbi:superoxide dismutase [Sulfurifustis variabilis]|uniref:Superoxide dismutase n=1 Tax=Sulfurifustis variabilis TaxID=1675686 RepID=A0A1B4V5Q9_9GAMM|nr:superoxide dismutase family protein [Sulfurifustis variabilis]BAU48879.1 superoxide dismutase [Sulfurifustis variabilis]
MGVARNGAIIALSLLASSAFADQITVKMTLIDEKGQGKSIGSVQLEDGKDGLVIRPNLTGLPPGEHGFHVHEKPDCGPGEKDGKRQAGLAAGGHYDPKKTGKHEGPKGQGHAGDLPALRVGDKGEAKGQLTAPRLKVADLRGRSLMIHEGGDNYSDQPKPLGGGGGRIACGVAG